MTTLIKNGLVIDPQNNIHDYKNIIIKDGKIQTLTDDILPADNIIDAKGLVVCPGFVDIHMHEGDEIGLECLLRQGVTSGLAGNCGENRCNPQTFLSEKEFTLNLGLLAGHGYFREKYSKADKYGKVSNDELKKICLEMQKALDNGCIGVSFGLEYIPGTTKEEMLACAKLKGVKLISCHIRSCAKNAKSSIIEMIEVAKEANVQLQISHIGSMAGYGQMKECLDVIEEAKKDGVNIYCDCYPYLAYSTTIGSAVYDDGWMELMNCDYSDIEMCEGNYKGKRLIKEIFEKEHSTHPNYLTIGHVLKKDDINLAFSKDYIAVCSDAYLDNGQGHPRAAGAFAKYISSNISNLDKAIYKCSTLPAMLAHFYNKGSLSIGMDADIVIFNPNEIKDEATFDNPLLPPKGIKYVIMDGNIVVEDNIIQKNHVGKPLFA